MSPKELYELQEIDTERAVQQSALDEVRAELAGDATIMQARQRLALVEAEYNAQNAQRQDAQLAVEQLQEREQGVQNRLYSGAITNPRELEAYQDEHAMLRRQIAQAEDVLLERMVAVDEVQEMLNNARRAAASLAARRRQREPELRSRERGISDELETLNALRDELLPQIPPPILATYESLLVTRNGQAISRVESSRGRDLCGECRVALPRSDVQRVRSGETLAQCNNCRRILYMD